MKSQLCSAEPGEPVLSSQSACASPSCTALPLASRETSTTLAGAFVWLTAGSEVPGDTDSGALRVTGEVIDGDVDKASESADTADTAESADSADTSDTADAGAVGIPFMAVAVLALHELGDAYLVSPTG